MTQIDSENVRTPPLPPGFPTSAVPGQFPDHLSLTTVWVSAPTTAWQRARNAILLKPSFDCLGPTDITWFEIGSIERTIVDRRWQR